MSEESRGLSEPDLLHPGVRIDGKYRIEGTLGSGGTAIVFSATQEELQRLVAIKVIRSELLEHSDAANQLMSEATTVAQIRSEHAARILDVGQLEDGRPYIVMEHLEGSDFASLLQKHGPAPYERVVDWLLQASVAIAEAHSLGIIHRDLKPHNLYLANTPKGEPMVKVLDFGISTTTTSRVLTAATGKFKRIDGSPHYMSPEQMQGLQEDARADIWSLGVLMFELLTGETPFSGETFEEIYGNTLRYSPPLDRITNTPASLIQVIGRCLQKSPEQRYPNVAEFALALEPLASLEGKRCVRAIERISNGNAPGGSAEAWSRQPGLIMQTEDMNDEPQADLIPAATPIVTVKRKTLGLAILAGGAALAAIAFSLSGQEQAPAPQHSSAIQAVPAQAVPVAAPTATVRNNTSQSALEPAPASTADTLDRTLKTPPIENSSTTATRPTQRPQPRPARAMPVKATPAKAKLPHDNSLASGVAQPTPKASTAPRPVGAQPKARDVDDPNWAWKRGSFGKRR